MDLECFRHISPISRVQFWEARQLNPQIMAIDVPNQPPTVKLVGSIAALLAAFPKVEPEKVSANQPRPSDSDWIEPLSDRELEVLQLIAEGLSRQEIATRLVLSFNTVKSHVRNIYGKLGVNNQMQAVGKARGVGLLENE